MFHQRHKDGQMFSLAQTLLYLSTGTVAGLTQLNVMAQRRSTYPRASSMISGTKL